MPYTDKVLLVMNTASFCGFTPQYKGSKPLHARYKDQGLVVLGFPSERLFSGNRRQQGIAISVRHLRCQIPDVRQGSVRGPDANPLYKQLAAQTGKTPAWNFHKYLIGRNGKIGGQLHQHGFARQPVFL